LAIRGGFVLRPPPAAGFPRSRHSGQVREPDCRKESMAPSHYVFNHIPKTGGMSLLAVCRANLEDSAISPHLRGDDLAPARIAELEQYRLVAGHFGLPAQSAFSPSRYSITLVRHPVRTIFSQYAFWRATPDVNAVTRVAKEMSFAGFVHYFADCPTVVHNQFTHHFASLDRDTPGEPLDPDLLLAIAKHNISAFDFVGVSEELSDSIRLLCTELNWQPPERVPHENRTDSKALIGEIGNELAEFLASRNRMDLELYEFARALFHARLASTDQGDCRHYGAEYTSRPRPIELAALPHIHRVERNRFLAFPATHLPPRPATIERVSAAWAAESRILEVAVALRPVAHIDELIVGMSIRDSGGQLVYGTNTQILGEEVKNEAGRLCEVVFSLECRLPPGRYSVAAALSRTQTTGYHFHWVGRATLFEAGARTPCAGPVPEVDPAGFRSTFA
jgi:Wzt C-terminal domain/Sulfotransferase family